MENKGYFKGRRQKRSFLLAVIFIFFTANTFSQVTVGSNANPEKAALLDLKTLKFEDQTRLVSSGNGGILLPRVEIADVTILGVFSDITGLDTSIEKSKHTGLVVYNVGTAIEEGIYVWDGTMWKKAGINKSQNFFYMPSIEIDLSAAGSIDLYARYRKQFATPAISSHPSIAPTIAFYNQDELYYYVTEYSSDLFDSITLSDQGILSYTPKSSLPDDVCCSYINIVFVVK
ncbi:MAG: hypothetical protein E6767_14165 [Dysgonomonas sp.]|nr:hypothetical protein [Dysgonomonas sp.]